MTVLYFADTRFPIERANGAQTMATCHALAVRGHDVTLVVRPDTAPTARDPHVFYDLPHAPSLTIQTIPSTGHRHTRRVRFLMSAAAMAARTSGIVYTRDLGLAAFLLQAPFIRRPRVVYESHGVGDVVASELPTLLGGTMRPPSPTKLARLARREARVWKRAAAYVTITQALADELRGRFGDRGGVFVVPDGARPRTVRPPSASPFVVAYAGHLYPWKGVDVLVRAMARLPGVHGLIVGGHPAEGDRQRVEALAREIGVADRLTFTGQLAPADVATHLTMANVLALPNTASAISARYTSPLKLFEYLVLGRAIVASDLPSIREVLTHDTSALLVPPGNVEALADAIHRLETDPALARRLATASHALAPHYTWARRAERIEAALEAAAS